MEKKSSSWLEFAKTIFWAVVIAVIFRSFLFEPFSIPSGSMIPTLRVGDYLFVSKYSYGYSRYSFPFALVPFDGRIWRGEPEYGDVVVFRRPGNESVDFIKRLVGKPGDRIAVVDSVLFINGVEVKRKLTSLDPEDPAGQDQRVMPFTETMPNGVEYTVLERSLDNPDSDADNMPEQIVPTGHYFFMGDNRDRSNDSRIDVGPVPERNLIGRAEFLFFSHNGRARFWQIWKWPFAIRFSRIGMGID
jgi:signal peptidase I